MMIIRLWFFLSVCPFIFPVHGGIYDSYATPDYYGQYGGYSGYSPLGSSLLNPYFPSSPFGWPQYGAVTPWSTGGLFGLTRATGQSDRYGGNLGYNYGCMPFCAGGLGF